MQRRKLGSGFDISALGLGCMGMSEVYGPQDNLSAFSVHLERDELSELNRTLDALPVCGERDT